MDAFLRRKFQKVGEYKVSRFALLGFANQYSTSIHLGNYIWILGPRKCDSVNMAHTETL